MTFDRHNIFSKTYKTSAPRNLLITLMHKIKGNTVNSPLRKEEIGNIDGICFKHVSF